MRNQKVISREYKIVLKKENFTGNENDLIEKANIFCNDLKKIIDHPIKLVHEDFDVIKSRREIRFYDTNVLTLRSKNYIFRIRRDVDDNKTEATLKFRHPDRYISQHHDMDFNEDLEGEIKFEEDIKSPFITLYSFSSTVTVAATKGLKGLKDVIELYPGLDEELNKDEEKQKIISVSELSIFEIVVTGPKIIINDDTQEKAECAFIVWYDLNASDVEPVFVEFSFRYGSKKEKYSREASQNAYALFKLIQEKMKYWIDTENATKTGFIYNDKIS